MLTVHHLGISQSERIVWLCEELGIEYELRRYERNPVVRMAPDDYKALHPMGMAPVITDGDFALAESGAICEYIDRKYGGSRLSPGPDHPDFAEHVFWFHFANGTVMQIAMVLMAIQGGPQPFALRRWDGIKRMIEARLGEAPFFGGAQITTADIMMGFALTTLGAFLTVAPLADGPNAKAYLKRIAERPAYRAAMDKAEPGMAPMIGG